MLTRNCAYMDRLLAEEADRWEALIKRGLEILRRRREAGNG